MNTAPDNSAAERPRVFYKYVSSSTAILILSRTALRWSSPLLFNDPFDVPRELAPPNGRQELATALLSRLVELIESPPDSLDELHPGVVALVSKLNAAGQSDLKAQVLKSIDSVALSEDVGQSALDGLRSEWKAMLPKLRILCLTQSPKHVAMWHHYADKYTGAVLAFECIPALDSAWLAAKPVDYPFTRPELFTHEGWVRLLTERSSVAVGRLLDLALYTKSTDWSYEAEWRVASQMRPTDAGLFSDYKFHPNELIGVYMGPLITLRDADVIRNLVRGYPSARLYSVRTGCGPSLEIENAG